ncbi:hypothetical protein [Streptosporangium sp. NPDC002721]|uniref:hypothetical protein n=1 Tax=Streptosporangium sp. NPDC002721 TaxID=3366188 RepID=UPI0036CADEE9
MTMTDWIRPWWRGYGAGDHARLDCPVLARQTSTPVEGSGWLNPQAGITCTTCVHWKAECSTCDAFMADELEDDHDGAFTEEDARQWKRDHRCDPIVRITPPHRDTPPAIPPGQELLPFTFEDAAA